MQYKVGLKFYANNIEFIPFAIKQFKKKLFDYIELYVVPGDFLKYGKNWKDFDIPFVIHAAHCLHGVNLSKKSHKTVNRNAYEEAKKFADILQAEEIIFHPGLAGEVLETVRQINSFKDKRIVIENKPFIALNGKRCVGGSISDIRSIMKKCGVGFCLDITHAVKYAYSNEIDCLSFLRDFALLKPRLIHITDGCASAAFDEHIPLGKGDFDFAGIVKALGSQRDVMVTLETPKKLSSGLGDFRKDVLFLNKILK